jgi:hypothetical protein
MSQNIDVSEFIQKHGGEQYSGSSLVESPFPLDEDDNMDPFWKG